jgi:hypothetical protein
MTRSFPVNRAMPKLERDTYLWAGSRCARCSNERRLHQIVTSEIVRLRPVDNVSNAAPDCFFSQGRTRIFNHEGYGE